MMSLNSKEQGCMMQTRDLEAQEVLPGSGWGARTWMEAGLCEW